MLQAQIYLLPNEQIQLYSFLSKLPSPSNPCQSYTVLRQRWGHLAISINQEVNELWCSRERHIPSTEEPFNLKESERRKVPCRQWGTSQKRQTFGRYTNLKWPTETWKVPFAGRRWNNFCSLVRMMGYQAWSQSQHWGFGSDSLTKEVRGVSWKYLWICLNVFPHPQTELKWSQLAHGSSQHYFSQQPQGANLKYSTVD